MGTNISVSKFKAYLNTKEEKAANGHVEYLYETLVDIASQSCSVYACINAMKNDIRVDVLLAIDIAPCGQVSFFRDVRRSMYILGGPRPGSFRGYSVDTLAGILYSIENPDALTVHVTNSYHNMPCYDEI